MFDNTEKRPTRRFFLLLFFFPIFRVRLCTIKIIGRRSDIFTTGFREFGSRHDKNYIKDPGTKDSRFVRVFVRNSTGRWWSENDFTPQRDL